MRLKEYMKNLGLTEAELTVLFHSNGLICGSYALRAWVSGARRPKLESMIKIEKITNGMVTVTDWIKK